MAADPAFDFIMEWFYKHDTPPTVRQVWKAAQRAVVAKPARNTGSPKLPTLAETIEYVSGEMESPNYNWQFLVRETYEFIERQLRAVA